MGSGASRVMPHSHVETTIVDRVIEALSPRSLLPLSSEDQNQKTREVQGRNRCFSDPLVKYELPTTKKEDTNDDITIATTTRTNQRSVSDDSQPENSSSSRMKYIFSSIHTLPSFGSSRKRSSNKTHRQTFPNPQVNKNTPSTTAADNNNMNNLDDNNTNVIFNKRPVDSIKLRERQYWIERKTDAFIVRGSWNEIQILSLLSKPFSGKTITMQSKSKNKYKHVRTVGVASPRDQK